MKKTKNRPGTSVIEIGFEVTEGELAALESLLRHNGYAFYVEPGGVQRWEFATLEELEAACEGK